jgi:hypothetical protein
LDTHVLALALFKARILLVNYVESSLSAYEYVIRVSFL